MFVAACPLVLASASPRRHALLQSLGLSFSCVPTEIDETPRAHEEPAAFAMRMARSKAETAGKTQPASACVVAADTVVAVNNRILGKPKDHSEALSFLSQLNGQMHTVITGYCVQAPFRNLDYTDHVCTRVQFGQFEENVLAAYAAGSEPMDKAGAYAMQGTGCFLVSAVSGSSTNVIGLPVEEVVQLLLEYQLIAPVADMASLAA